jgi:predicted RNA polymerase sigma factor
MVLAGVLAELGMREEAKEEYREVLRIDQHNREAQELLRR